jgi:hypothetical protein
MNPFRREILLLSLFMTVHFLASCSSPAKIPQAALEALEAQWLALPGSVNPDLRVLRAWPGDQPLATVPPGSTEMEIWCVEVQVSAGPAEVGGSGSTIWIIIRDNQDTSWEAAWLMTMSSLWPYQACGVVR